VSTARTDIRAARIEPEVSELVIPVRTLSGYFAQPGLDPEQQQRPHPDAHPTDLGGEAERARSGVGAAPHDGRGGLGGLAAFGHPGVRRRMQLAVLVGTTVVFGLTLVLVHELDRPYDGWVRIDPTVMLDAARRIAALPGGEAPPCTPDGTPVYQPGRSAR
jgi:hypothetical protein